MFKNKKIGIKPKLNSDNCGRNVENKNLNTYPLSLLYHEPCIIEMRDGQILFASKIDNGLICFFDKDFELIVNHSCYNNDLLFESTLNDPNNACYDIMKIYYPYSICAMKADRMNENFLVWQREEILELTLKDIAEKFGVKEEQIIIKD